LKDQLKNFKQPDPSTRKPVRKHAFGKDGDITAEEDDLLKTDGTEDIWKFYGVGFDSVMAEGVAKVLFIQQPYGSNPRNAFQHAYWSAEMTIHFGSEYAEKFATAHETIPDNRREEAFMDMYNNKVGRSIGNANAFGMSPLREIIAAVETYVAVQTGYMVVLDSSDPPNPYFSNQLP
jgi:hypothetical protein